MHGDSTTIPAAARSSPSSTIGAGRETYAWQDGKIYRYSFNEHLPPATIS